MRRTELIARLFITAIGLYLLLIPLWSLSSVIAIGAASNEIFFWRTIITLIPLAVWFLVFYQVWFNAGQWAKVMYNEEVPQSPIIERKWIIVGFKVVYFLFGTYWLSGSIKLILQIAVFIVKGPRVLFEMYLYKYVDNMFLIDISSYLRIVSELFNLGVALYLLMGAPHLLRWQLRQFEQNILPVKTFDEISET